MYSAINHRILSENGGSFISSKTLVLKYSTGLAESVAEEFFSSSLLIDHNLSETAEADKTNHRKTPQRNRPCDKIK